jgi:hypothetical protein
MVTSRITEKSRGFSTSVWPRFYGDCGENGIRIVRRFRARSAVLARWKTVLQFDHSWKKARFCFAMFLSESGQQFTHRPGVVLGCDRHAGVQD